MQPPHTRTPTTTQTLEQAIAHHQAGRLQEAEQLYKIVLQAEPREPDANHNLGLIATRVGRHDIALPLYQTALSVNLRHPQLLGSYAGCLLSLGRAAEAEAVLRRGFAQGVHNQALQELLDQAQATPDPQRAQHQEALALFQLFQLGLHNELQPEARRLLEQFPESGFIWKILGASLQVQGKDAVEALRRASQLLPDEADAQHNLAVALLGRGQYAEAASMARRALRITPQFPAAWRNLGNALHGLRDIAGAAEAYRRSLALTPDADTHFNLGLCLQTLGHVREALEQLQLAARQGMQNATLHHQMGNALFALGRPDEAALAYRRAIERDPRLAVAMNNLGNLLHSQGRVEEAAQQYRQALKVHPFNADAHNNLGVALRDLGQREAALESFQRAITCRVEFAAAHSNLGNLLHEAGQIEEGLAHCRHAVACAPQMAATHGNLGHVLHQARRYDEALASLQQATTLAPEFAEAWSNLGALYRDMNRPTLSVHACSKALELNPDNLDCHSNLLFSANYLPGARSSALLQLARRYGDAAKKRARPYTSWSDTALPPNTLLAQSALRVGFVSADLRQHPVGHFLEAVIAALHAGHGKQFQLYAYANSRVYDELSQRLRPHFTAWRNVSTMPDARLAQAIHDDRIDILIDLSGHTTGTRLSAFAWKPAPVQVSWLGYFASTGLAAIDYFVADPWTVPEGCDEQFSEKVWRLPQTRLCFSAPSSAAQGTIEPGPLPARSGHGITFGSCSNLSKLGDPVLALWARILQAVPGSRLLLKAMQLDEAARRDELATRFATLGIAAERLLLEGHSSREDYLEGYRRIDIALDPFPYTGATTTVEALWMGVPVLTLAGKSLVARQGAGLLANAGLPDWIAADADDYLAKAVKWSRDLDALERLRQGLRAQVLASPVFDAKSFAGHFAAMLHAMWQGRPTAKNAGILG